MREILFRAKRADNGEWVEGYFAIGKWYLDEKERHAILPIDLCFYPHCEINEWIEIDPETVCQYTGLTDKNGKRIWENDIVKIGANTLVRWSKKYAGWCLVQRGWMYEHFFGEAIDERDCEVVGNIFDNPELLKGE